MLLSFAGVDKLSLSWLEALARIQHQQTTEGTCSDRQEGGHDGVVAHECHLLTSGSTAVWHGTFHFC